MKQQRYCNLFICALILVLLFVGRISPARAIPITVSFDVAGFGAGAPTDPVIGSITYDAASTTSNINSVTSVSLTIAGHVYTVGELGFQPDNLIGGLLNGTGVVLGGTNDFSMGWFRRSRTPGFFAYATANTDDFFLSTNFLQFSVTAASAVPEPSSWTLLLSGVVFLGWIARRKSRLGSTGPLRVSAR